MILYDWFWHEAGVFGAAASRPFTEVQETSISASNVMPFVTRGRRLSAHPQKPIRTANPPMRSALRQPRLFRAKLL